MCGCVDEKYLRYKICIKKILYKSTDWWYGIVISTQLVVIKNNIRLV